MATRTRGGNGRYTRTIKTVKRDFDAAQLHAEGATFEEIAAALGFASRGHAHDAVTRALRDTPYAGAEEDKLLDLYRINLLLRHSFAVMRREHITVSQGKIIGRYTGRFLRDEDGQVILDHNEKPVYEVEELEDDAPGMMAVREIRALLERRAKIIGYDAPVRTRVEVITDDVVNEEIARLVAELGEADTAAPGPGIPREP